MYSFRSKPQKTLYTHVSINYTNFFKSEHFTIFAFAFFLKRKHYTVLLLFSSFSLLPFLPLPFSFLSGG